MSVIINGKRYVAAYLNGKRYDKGYFNGKLVLAAPPDNNAYLMASTKVKLLASEKDVMVWTTTPQVLINTLTGAKDDEI